MKKITALILAMLLTFGLAGAVGADDTITVVSREEGSGTRGAFIELLGIEVKNEDGDKEDMTTEEAEITNRTSVAMTSVAGNPGAIGYISLGSLNDTVKALAIDGAEATVENIKSGEYAVARPFNIVLSDKAGDAAKAFVEFVLSAEGQAIVEENGYISTGEPAPFSGSAAQGKIVIAGSSSVTPVMEKLTEAYAAISSGVEIEVQQSDSTTGIMAALDGICDIGMASRQLKDSELEAGLEPIVIAMDGIAVIVNNDNPVSGLTSDQVRSVYTGETTTWSDLNG